VHRNERRHTKAAHVLGANFGARALRGDHDDGDVVADLHALFDEREARALLHQRHDGGDDRGVLLVGGEVEHDVCGGQQFFIGADGEAVLRRVLPRLTLLCDGRFAERVGNVKAAVAKVQALVEPLSAAADHDDLLAHQGVDAFVEFVELHKTALAEFGELLAQ